MPTPLKVSRTALILLLYRRDPPLLSLNADLEEGGNESCSLQLARAARLDLAISWVSVCSLCRRASLLVWRKGKGKAVKTSELKFYGAGRRLNESESSVSCIDLFKGQV